MARAVLNRSHAHRSLRIVALPFHRWVCFDLMGYDPQHPEVMIGSLPIFSWVPPSLNALCVNE